MKSSALIGCAAALAASTALSAPNPAFLMHKFAQPFISGSRGSKTLHDQNKDGSGKAIISQTSGSGGGPQAADDFFVPAGHRWDVKEVDVTGIYYDGYGPANSESVYFYEDSKGLPGKPVASCPGQIGRENGSGSFAITLSKKCKAILDGGPTGMASGRRYWVSVQIDMGGNQSTQWGWELSTDAIRKQAAYRFPGAELCPDWATFEKCFGAPGYLMFDLKGKDSH